MQANTHFEKTVNKKRKQLGYDDTRQQAKAEDKERRQRRAAKRNPCTE